MITLKSCGWTCSGTTKRFLQKSNEVDIPGKGQQNTPVVEAEGLVTIMNLLQGERAATFRAAEADVLVKCLGGDLSLI